MLKGERRETLELFSTSPHNHEFFFEHLDALDYHSPRSCLCDPHSISQTCWLLFWEEPRVTRCQVGRVEGANPKADSRGTNGHGVPPCRSIDVHAEVGQPAFLIILQPLLCGDWDPHQQSYSLFPSSFKPDKPGQLFDFDFLKLCSYQRPQANKSEDL